MPRLVHGFSLIEVVIAMALTTTVLACVFALVDPAQGAFAREPELADMQQRLRVAVDTLTRDLSAAGAGTYTAGRRGPLMRFFAPLLPFGLNSSSSASGIVGTEAVTVIAVPGTPAQTTLAADLLPGVLTLQAVAESGCPVGTTLCGFAAGLTLAVYDGTGTFGVFTVASVDDAAAQITLASRPADSLSTTYRSGSNVAQVRLDTYSLKADAAAQTFQLMHAQVPVLDHVVGLAFDYYGEPRPPNLTAGVTSYGPAPPPIGTQTTAYPAGENCTFQVDAASGTQVPRLATLAAGTELVSLTSAQLDDGPWCPDETSASRWDADLLRIRRIGVTVRVEAALAALRGPAGVLFANGGASRAASLWVPDQEIRFQVSPRNMNPGRP